MPHQIIFASWPTVLLYHAILTLLRGSNEHCGALSSQKPGEGFGKGSSVNLAYSEWIRAHAVGWRGEHTSTYSILLQEPHVILQICPVCHARDDVSVLK